MDNEILSPTNDFVFKLLFGDGSKLASFIANRNAIDGYKDLI